MPLLSEGCPRCEETSGLQLSTMFQRPMESQVRLQDPTEAFDCGIPPCYAFGRVGLPSHGPTDSTSADKVEFLNKFRHHVGLAKSHVWLSMLSQQPPDELAAHQWTCGQTDYNLVLWSGHLNAALREGLQYPILIPGESPLGQDDAVVGDACGRLSTSLCCPLPAISSFVTALILQRRQKPLRR